MTLILQIKYDLILLFFIIYISFYLNESYLSAFYFHIVGTLMTLIFMIKYDLILLLFIIFISLS